jgi:hypothetical protein
VRNLYFLTLEDAFDLESEDIYDEMYECRKNTIQKITHEAFSVKMK